MQQNDNNGFIIMAKTGRRKKLAKPDVATVSFSKKKKRKKAHRRNA